MTELFPASRTVTVRVDDASLFARIGGEGPPLLLLHGFPQTHAMWHRLYPDLSRRFTCVMPDLRGYGRSSVPQNDRQNRAFSKRRMGEDVLALMTGLGFPRFAVAGHDRGGRVAYRLALDHPQAVSALAVLDIMPTLTMWRTMERSLAMRVYHWLMLAQPSPLPEMMLAGDPVGYLDVTMASWTKAKDLSGFDPRALDEYRAAFSDPERRRGACEDYRAGATIDPALDEADLAAGRTIACPLLALWGDGGIPSQSVDMLQAWRPWRADVTGHAIDAGHFLAEENPQATLDALLPFLDRHGR